MSLPTHTTRETFAFRVAGMVATFAVIQASAAACILGSMRMVLAH